MNNIDNIEHTLSVINEIGSKTDDSLEKKKNEQTLCVGGVISAKEFKEQHEKFMLSCKENLVEEMKKNKIPEPVVNYVMSWLKKSNDLAKKFLADKTTQMNSKSGEVIALENTVKMLKSYYDSYSEKKQVEIQKIKELEEKKKEEQASPPVEICTPMFAEVVEVAPIVPPKKKRKARPDEVGPYANTVKRIKNSRNK